MLVFLLTVEFCAPGGFLVWLRANLVALAALLLMLGCALIYASLRQSWRGALGHPVQVQAVSNQNYQFLTFLTTYIVPLACLDLSSGRYLLVLVVLLFCIGWMFLKLDLYLGNPTLALLGYRLYQIAVSLPQQEEPQQILVITRDKLAVADYVEWISLDEGIWYVRRCQA